MEKSGSFTRAARTVLAVLVVTSLVFGLTACSGRANAVDNNSGAFYNTSGDYVVSPTISNEMGGGNYGFEALSYNDSVTTAQYESALSSEFDGSTALIDGQVNSAGNVQDGRKITFWADITFTTKNFGADYQAIISMIQESGGYIASESMWDYSSYDRNQGRTATLNIKVPASGYNSFLDGIAGIGTVTSRNMWSDDLTAVYFDTEARIELLELRKERLMNYLLEAERAEDIVEFERELSSVLYDLDSYQSTRRQLDQLVDYATVNVTLTELITPETIGVDGEPLGERASNAFGLAATGVGKFLQDVVVWLAGALPVLALLLVIALIIWAVVMVVKLARKSYKGSSAGQAKQKRKEEAMVKKMENNIRLQALHEQAQANAYQQHPQAPQAAQSNQATQQNQP